MVTIKRILCPVDFSDFSRNAFDHAVAIAHRYHATVTALHMVPISSAASLLPASDMVPSRAIPPMKVDREGLTRDLEGFLDVGDSSGVLVRYEVSEAPDVPVEILERADRLPADLIVLGTHGRTGVRRFLFGSVAETLLRSARQPVLTVPPKAPQAVPLGAPFLRILCALDFSECSLGALRYAASLAEHPDVRLTVLHVVEITPPAYNPAMGPPIDLAGFQIAFERAGREQLQHAVPDAVRQACRIEEMTTTGKPYREILRIAGERAADLIVLGSQGHGPIDRFMFGSTAEPVVRRASCPVLTIRPTPQTAAGASTGVV
jgi:nucleotide-binding universal stress UspA family protein